MKHLKYHMIIGTVFVLILGTLAHFFYEWSGSNTFVGYFTPVSESVWEHIKLLFFPMLLYIVFITPKLKADYPSIFSGLSSGILLGTFLIPVLFYTYTGILGQDSVVMDITVFVVSVILAFYTGYRLTLSCKMQKYTIPLLLALCILALCFFLFTYSPPSLGLFAQPSEYYLTST